MNSEVMVVPTGTANTASILAAFRRLGANPVIARDPSEISVGNRVVVPGVGSFGAAMGEIDRAGMRDAMQVRLGEGRPTLAVCVGMQLLAVASEESNGAKGLAILDTHATRFPGNVLVPQLGWNQVTAEPGARFLSDGWAYFANSYRLEEVPDTWIGATADYGGSFVAGLERGDVLACQFHPELSGAWGSGILARWLEGKAT